MAKKSTKSHRELIDTGKDKRFVRRDDQGQFEKVDDVGRSLTRDRQQEANRLIQEVIRQGDNLDYIDEWSQFLGPDGKPREELFQPDRLHSNEAGYKLRAQIVRPHLAPPPKS